MSDSKAPSETPSEPGVESQVDKTGTNNGDDSIITDIPVLHTAKRLKVEARKLDGMQRELYSLMGENAAPVVVTPESKFKTRPEWQQRATPWKLAEFSPKEGLTLKHWVRAASLVDGTFGDRFAAFNKETDVPEWSDSQYKLFERESWTLEETRYLFALAKEYDLRWLVIADRYNFKQPNSAKERENMNSESSKNNEESSKNNDEDVEMPNADREKLDEGKSGDKTDHSEAKFRDETAQEEDKMSSTDKQARDENQQGGKADEKKASSTDNKTAEPQGRTVDDLKERFYEVWRALIRSKPITAELGLSPHDEELLEAMKFDRESEVKRKAHLERLLSRNPKEVAEEEALILEARRLEGLAGKLQSERQDLLRLLDSPANLTNANALKLELSTSHGVGQLLQDLNNDKVKRNVLATTSGNKDGSKPGENAGADKPALTTNGAVAPAARKAVAKIVNSTLNRDLTPREEAMLGISYSEASKSKAPGVYLRSSRLTPVRQNLLPKVRAITAEIGLPLRPVMPTQRVCAQYESLYQNITLLLEAKKIQDKLEMEVEILQKAKNMPPKTEDVP